MMSMDPVKDGLSISSRQKECDYHYDSVGANYIHFGVTWFNAKSNDDFGDGSKTGYVCDSNVCVGQFVASISEWTATFDGDITLGVIGKFPMDMRRIIADAMYIAQERWTTLDSFRISGEG